MAKRDIEKKVGEALRALTADKESSIRKLVIALDSVGDLDGKIVALNAKRNTAIEAVERQHEAARSAGWKAKDLADAGLNVPRVLDLVALGGPAEEARPVVESSPETHPDEA